MEDRKKQEQRVAGSELSEQVTRRSFLGRSIVGIGGLTTLRAAKAQLTDESDGHGRAGARSQGSSLASKRSSFVEILRVPDSVTLYGGVLKTLPVNPIRLVRNGEQWSSNGCVVESRVGKDSLVLTLTAGSTPMSLVHVRWTADVMPNLITLGDAWERSYGELGWRGIEPERVMPWYFATHDGTTCHGYGVRTDARALCFWQLDQEGVSLWLNVMNGGSGVVLGERRLMMATVAIQQGQSGEEPFSGVKSLCRSLCARTSRPIVPIYGANDWCYSYGNSTAESILRDTEFTVGLSPAGATRPYSVIDGGWRNGTPRWPDMGVLAEGIKQRQARPGLWVRPLEAAIGTPRGLLLPDARFGQATARAQELAYDPTVPEAQQKIREKLHQLAGWGYEMVKHDFSTYDLLGQWGFEMGPMPTIPGWALNDRSRTNAEVLMELYALIRESVGEAVIVDGCNTVGHLGQGIFDLQRTGDDTSGRQWERTRRMGVNTLAFRLPQNGTFFVVDPDVVGITEAVPWEFNRQWLHVLASSGAATMVSAGPPAHGPEQMAALRDAFAMASAGGKAARPTDWMQTGTPERWQEKADSGRSKKRLYQWNGPGGASPFLGP
jgi:alpha-galactosidase